MSSSQERVPFPDPDIVRLRAFFRRYRAEGVVVWGLGFGGCREDGSRVEGFEELSSGPGLLKARCSLL